MGLNRRTLYAFTLHLWPINAADLKFAQNPVVGLKSVPPSSGHFMLPIAVTLRFK
jgi:hypothetical protein